jgi:hypothetical protein
MFDFRYHVTSLAAVFIALVIGILVGVAISGRTLIKESERLRLEARIGNLQNDLDAAERQVAQQNALDEYQRETYLALMEGRLADKRIGVVYLGSAEGEVAGSIQETIDRADGTSTMRALKLPIATGELLRRVGDLPEAPQTVEDLGRALAAELVDGGDTPLWDAVGPVLVEEREGGSQPLDAVVVARTAEPQQGQTARFLAGFYAGLAAAGVPVVGAETTDSEPTAVLTFRGHGLSTIDNVDTITGRVALAVLLTGESPGSYGFKEDNTPVLPRVDPVPAPTG